MQRREKLSDTQLNRRNQKTGATRSKESNLYFVTRYSTPQRDAKLKPSSIVKVTSVCDLSVGAKGLTPRCSRSLSLQDISPACQERLQQRR